MRWMCNGFEEQGRKSKMVANDGLERLIRWRESDVQVISTMYCGTKLV